MKEIICCFIGHKWEFEWFFPDSSFILLDFKPCAEEPEPHDVGWRAKTCQRCKLIKHVNLATQPHGTGERERS